MSSTPVEPTPASSVILLRDAPAGLEVLYLRRNPTLAFHGGYWVFPGGRIDPDDYTAGGRGDLPAAARRAAVREAREEAGLDVSDDSLAFAIHWTTPTTSRIRFATWFFVAPTTGETVTIDGGEIHEHQWLQPSAALDQQRAGTVKLAAPTFALTTRLTELPDVDAAISTIATWPEERLLGHLRDVDGGTVALYHQDVAYDDGRLHQDGPRHRLWMVESGWRYERTF